ncbi:hypothetical protein PHYC_01164 [Phycisphaerales bacterium]|nr:hypothetical protein PHYC_01164 [Phycisphaerales bacterium]
MSENNLATGTGRCDALAAAADSILSQCESLLLEVPDSVYIAEAQTIQGGTLGKHLRHTLDHFAAAFTHAGPIDYDHRARNVPMETDRQAALAQVAFLKERAGSLGHRLSGDSVSVRVMIAGDGREMILGSTLGREMAFATHHAVHHLAMMRAIAGAFGIDLPDVVGKAPSTINFERQAGR